MMTEKITINQKLIGLRLYADYDIAIKELNQAREKIKDEKLLSAIIIAYAHLARRYEKLDKVNINFVKSYLKSNSDILAKQANSAIEDINLFVLKKYK